jgi:hypothetical protein
LDANGVWSSWASWNENDDSWAADTIGNYVIDNESEITCVDATDSDGIAFASVFLLNVQDEEDLLSNDELDKVIPYCVSVAGG